MNMPTLQFKAGIRLMIILIPVITLALLTNRTDFWLLVLLTAAFVAFTDLGLNHKDLLRVTTPLIIGIWLAVFTAYFSGNPLFLIIFLMTWSVVQAVSYAIHPLDGLSLTLTLLLYWTICAARILDGMPPVDILLATILGTGWSFLIVFSSSYLAKQKRKPMNLPEKENILKIIRKNLTFRSYYFVFGIIRGIAITIGLLLYILDKNHDAFWIGLTILIVMIPEIKEIQQKVRERILGTIAGVIVILTILIFIDSVTVIMAILFGTLFLYRVLIGFNYALDSFLTTILVLCIMAFTTTDVSTLGGLRIIDTIIGAVIALALSYIFIFNHESFQKS